MRREGSALHGFGVVTLKEIADRFTSILVVVLIVLVVATAIAVVRGGIDQIKEITAEDPFLFLRLFTRSSPLPLVALLSFLVPLIAIGLGFDAVNGEHNRRTLSRILAQPIYRDALLFGKFAAGLFTLAVCLIVLWLLVIGLGLLGLGVPPNAEEMARALVLLAVTIVYAGFWFALALLCSVVFRSAATAALVALGLWLFVTILWPLFSPALADAVTTAGDILGVLDTRQAFARLSPSVLFNEIVAVVLDPSVRSTQQSMLAALGLALIERGAVPDAPIPLLQSVLIVWPQIVGLVAGTILLFVAAYIVFQRQEVRA
ncbi:MAG: ABC transporter permease subunit [Hyphomicrobiaceae bacterium]|jgi:ABC-2 type transport system permease protein|nr:ABC transporter permease subunit [Hyphomicrobiaceae bacterium]HYZ45696.1 ABC transporter permease [Xanthobacteraceae bacterium]